MRPPGGFLARTFRWRLRTMFILVALVAVLVAWLANTRDFVRNRGELLPYLGGESSLFAAALLPPDARPEISWIRRWLGDLSIPSLMYDPRRDPTGSELRQARKLFPEARIRVWAGLSADGLPAGIELATNQGVGDPPADIGARIE
jgi:hypothetical protein